MKKEKEIRSKGDYEEQGIYFVNSSFARCIADVETGRVKREQKRIALWSRAKALILQNPRPEDLPKHKIHK